MTKLLRCYVAVISRNGCSLYAKTGCLAFFNNQSPEYERSKIAKISIYYTVEGNKKVISSNTNYQQGLKLKNEQQKKL